MVCSAQQINNPVASEKSPVIRGPVVFYPPAVESLINWDIEIWSEQITQNEQLKTQIRERRKMISAVERATSRLPNPNTTLEQALRENFVNEDQLVNLFESLSDLLRDPDYWRALLYIPFEFLPRTEWKPNSEVLAQEISRFRSYFMTAWKQLLIVQDVRANFVDGDILEVQSRTGDLPRVVKAAHLIPKLIESGFMSVVDAMRLREKSNDAILQKSIDDALMVMADMGFVSQDMLADMRISQDTSASQNHPAVKITEKRKLWLAGEKKKAAIHAASKKITEAILDNRLADEVISGILSTEMTETEILTFIIGARNALDRFAAANPRQAKLQYEHLRPAMRALWQYDAPEIRKALATTFHWLYRRSIISSNEMTDLGILIPDLANPLSKNLTENGSKSEDIREGIASLEDDPVLARFLYPVVLLFGSRVKGYETLNADIDIAVFVKPGTGFAEKERIQAALKQNFSQKEIVQFWLEHSSSGLMVRNFEKTETLLGESYWTHVLFGGIWAGEAETIKELHKKLLPRYFSANDHLLHELPARQLYLEELERDALQYRLMHNGYARFFPPQGGIHTAHANRVDGNSMFWDSGYRQLAIRIFLKRVFLPKIKEYKIPA